MFASKPCSGSRGEASRAGLSEALLTSSCLPAAQNCAAGESVTGVGLAPGRGSGMLPAEDLAGAESPLSGGVALPPVLHTHFSKSFLVAISHVHETQGQGVCLGHLGHQSCALPPPMTPSCRAQPGTGPLTTGHGSSRGKPALFLPQHKTSWPRFLYFSKLTLNTGRR